MFHNIQNTLALPDYSSIKILEGKGNFAVKKYYQFPYSYFYKHKLKMIVKLLGKRTYNNILDYGSGSGIFIPELRKHAFHVKTHEVGQFLSPSWKFDAIVCSSVLEFCYLNQTLKHIRNAMNQNSVLFVASPMQTSLSKLYFKLIKDKRIRHSQEDIISAISKFFRVKEYHTWLGLYFSIKAVPL